jgi:RNA methyltransferase, TrmH family
VTPEAISSTANPRVKAAVRLRGRRERERSGLTIVDGAREIRRAIDAGVDVREAFVCDALVDSSDAKAAVAALERAHAPLVRVSRPVFDKLAFGERADGVVAVIEAPRTDLDALQLPRDAFLIVIEGVEKPGNLGAVLRSADGAGVDAVIAASPGTDLYNPNTIRASLGTVFSLPLAAADTHAVAAFLRAAGVRIVAARVDGLTSYTDIDLRGPVAIVVGSEHAGLTDAWSAPDVVTVQLPMLGVADSLNVSASAAVLLYEARRQRGVDTAESSQAAN